MARNVQLDTTASFTGGLNLRTDQLKVMQDQSPWMLNMEVDPTFGARSRRGWEDWLTVGAGEWDPRNMYSHMLPEGIEWHFVANTVGESGELWASNGGSEFVKADGVSCSASPHGADFGAWGDKVYVACGVDDPGCSWDLDEGWTVLGDPSVGDGNWSDDYSGLDDPFVDNMMPKAEVVATHDGYLWVANTWENGSRHPWRLRFSHPNKPDVWAFYDYIDFPEGGGEITGIIPFRDHLMIFFPQSVWALYGSNAQTFSKRNISETVGASNRQCLTRSESQVYFVSWPNGIYAVGPDSLVEVSEKLRPAFRLGGDFNQNPTLQWLNWANQRLYWSVPYSEKGAPSEATSVLVLDPSIGAWMLWRAGNGDAVAPICEGVAVRAPLGCLRTSAAVVQLDAVDWPSDLLNDVSYDFETVLRTPWQDSGYPTVKKRWKRPDLIVLEGDEEYKLELRVFHDLVETAARRTNSLVFHPSTSSAVWFFDENWDEEIGSESLENPEDGEAWDDWTFRSAEDGGPALWGTPARGSVIERSSGLGNAMSVQVELRGERGKRWGLTALVWKSIMRRVR